MSTTLDATNGHVGVFAGGEGLIGLQVEGSAIGRENNIATVKLTDKQGVALALELLVRAAPSVSAVETQNALYDIGFGKLLP